MDEDLDKLSSKSRADDDLKLWHQWNDNGRQPEHMRPLLSNFRGMIHSQVNRFSGQVEIPPAAIKAEFNKHFADAMKTYDPEKGAALGTWVTHKLKKGQRWISQHQNTARIAEARVYNIGKFNTAKSQLDDQFGRPPTGIELSEHLGWSLPEIERMEKMVRRDIIGSSMAVDPVEHLPNLAKERLQLIQYDLSGDELQVYEYTLGLNGKQQLDGNQIAGKLGMSPSRVSRIKTSIAQKMKGYF